MGGRKLLLKRGCPGPFPPTVPLPLDGRPQGQHRSALVSELRVWRLTDRKNTPRSAAGGPLWAPPGTGHHGRVCKFYMSPPHSGQLGVPKTSEQAISMVTRQFRQLSLGTGKPITRGKRSVDRGGRWGGGRPGKGLCPRPRRTLVRGVGAVLTRLLGGDVDRGTRGPRPARVVGPDGGEVDGVRPQPGDGLGGDVPANAHLAGGGLPGVVRPVGDLAVGTEGRQPPRRGGC